MASPWWGIVILIIMSHDAKGYSDLPPLKNYNLNETSESAHIKRILAFGDSLTEGFLAGGRKFYPYTTKLEEKLNAHFNWSRWEVLNEGISGECVFTEMVTRLPKLLDRVGNRVNLVIILGGTNDFHKLDCMKRVNVAHELITLHKIVHKAGLKSVLVTIPECASLGSKCEKARLKVNDKLRLWASEHTSNTLLCDLARFMPMANLSDFDRKVYWDDEVHPSRIGYDKIAALLFHTIREELEPPTLEETMPDILPKNKKKAAKKAKSKGKGKGNNKKGSSHSKKLHRHHQEKIKKLIAKAKAHHAHKQKLTNHKQTTFSSPNKMATDLESSYPVATSNAQLPSTNSTPPTFSPFLNGTDANVNNSSSTPSYYGQMSANNYSSAPSGNSVGNTPTTNNHFAAYSNSWNPFWSNSSWSNFSSPYNYPSHNSAYSSDATDSSNSSTSPYPGTNNPSSSNFTSTQSPNSTNYYNEKNYPSSNTSSYKSEGDTSSNPTAPYQTPTPSQYASNSTSTDTSAENVASNSTANSNSYPASSANTNMIHQYAAPNAAPNATSDLNSNSTNKYINTKLPVLSFTGMSRNHNRYAIH